jgi:hypothetical protein
MQQGLPEPLKNSKRIAFSTQFKILFMKLKQPVMVQKKGEASMMAGLFFLFSLAITSIIGNRRGTAIALLSIGILLSLLMFWHHATDVLKINW